VGGVDDHEYDGDYDDNETAEGHELFVGVLLVLIGLRQQNASFFEVHLGLFHLFQTDL
jgi:hypothetical protein